MQRASLCRPVWWAGLVPKSELGSGGRVGARPGKARALATLAHATHLY